MGRFEGNFEFDDDYFEDNIDSIDFEDIDEDDFEGDEFEEDYEDEEDFEDDGGDDSDYIDFDEEEIIDDTGLADHDGTIVDGEGLFSDDYEMVEDDADFISSATNDIVVMDTSEKGEIFKLIYVDIENIAVLSKRIRKSKNVEDLVRSIKSTGLLNPVVVAPTATEGIYVLLSGYRRLLACARAGIRNIPCVVNTRVNTTEIPVLEAIYNHSKAFSISEIVDYANYLEKEKGIMNYPMIEYLLQMNSGDYTKLKDLLNDDDEDILDKLFNGTYTIEQAFKKLEQKRKKLTAEERENKKAEDVYGNEEESGAEVIAGSGEEADEIGLTDDEIKELAISTADLDEVDDEALEDMINEGESIEGFQAHQQDHRNRERLDPALRKAVLARDKNTCQVCKAISGQEYIEVLDVHHIVMVFLGGKDEIENLLTTCVVCHKLIHLYGRGELYIRPLEELTEDEQVKFKRIVKLGNIIRKGSAMRGMKRDQLKKLDKAETIGRRLKGSSDQVAD